MKFQFATKSEIVLFAVLVGVLVASIKVMW